MDYIGTISDGFKKIFKCENALEKHVSLFALTGFIAVLKLYLNDVKGAEIMLEPAKYISIFLLFLIISIYIAGYGYSYIHNVFDEMNINILPDIDSKHFGVFWRALPLCIVWVLYIILVSFLGIIPIIGWIAFLVLMVIWIPFINFVFIAYCENFDAKGLYSIKLPLTYMKKSIKTCITFGLIFLPIGLLLGILVILPLSIAFINPDVNEVIPFIGALLGGYLSFAIGLVWSYCMVQVYKEKIIPC